MIHGSKQCSFSCPDLEQAYPCGDQCDSDFTECFVNICEESYINVDCMRDCTDAYDDCLAKCPCSKGGECEDGCPCPNFDCATTQVPSSLNFKG